MAAPDKGEQTDGLHSANTYRAPARRRRPQAPTASRSTAQSVGTAPVAQPHPEVFAPKLAAPLVAPVGVVPVVTVLEEGVPPLVELEESEEEDEADEVPEAVPLLPVPPVVVLPTEVAWVAEPEDDALEVDVELDDVEEELAAAELVEDDELELVEDDELELVEDEELAAAELDEEEPATAEELEDEELAVRAAAPDEEDEVAAAEDELEVGVPDEEDEVAAAEDELEVGVPDEEELESDELLAQPTMGA